MGDNAKSYQNGAPEMRKQWNAVIKEIQDLLDLNCGKAVRFLRKMKKSKKFKNIEETSLNDYVDFSKWSKELDILHTQLLEKISKSSKLKLDMFDFIKFSERKELLDDYADVGGKRGTDAQAAKSRLEALEETEMSYEGLKASLDLNIDWGYMPIPGGGRDMPTMNQTPTNTNTTDTGSSTGDFSGSRHQANQITSETKSDVTVNSSLRVKSNNVLLSGINCVVCAKPATMQCMLCVELGVGTSDRVFFCSFNCFKETFKDHKKVHKTLKAARKKAKKKGVWKKGLASVSGGHFFGGETSKTSSKTIPRSALGAINKHPNGDAIYTLNSAPVKIVDSCTVLDSESNESNFTYTIHLDKKGLDLRLPNVPHTELIVLKDLTLLRENHQLEQNSSSLQCVLAELDSHESGEKVDDY